MSNSDGEPAGNPDALDFDVVFDRDEKEFQVWTPDNTGGIIGTGKTEREALMNCIENLKLTIAAIQNPQ